MRHLQRRIILSVNGNQCCKCIAARCRNSDIKVNVIVNRHYMKSIIEYIKNSNSPTFGLLKRETLVQH